MRVLVVLLVLAAVSSAVKEDFDSNALQADAGRVEGAQRLVRTAQRAAENLSSRLGRELVKQAKQNLAAWRQKDQLDARRILGKVAVTPGPCCRRRRTNNVPVTHRVEATVASVSRDNGDFVYTVTGAKVFGAQCFPAFTEVREMERAGATRCRRTPREVGSVFKRSGVFRDGRFFIAPCPTGAVPGPEAQQCRN